MNALMNSVWWLVLAAAVAVGGLGLAGWALFRGVRRGRSRCCRACDFDLAGLDPTPALCPECGRDLAGPRRVALGARRRSPWLAGLGLALVLLGLGGGTLWLNRTTIPIHRYLPNIYLEHLAKKPSEWNKGAVAELAQRIAANRVPPTRVTRLVDVGLGAQDSTGPLPWAPEWWELLTKARDAGLMSEAQEIRAMQNTVSITPRVPKKMIAGHPHQVLIQTKENNGLPLLLHIPHNVRWSLDQDQILGEPYGKIRRKVYDGKPRLNTVDGMGSRIILPADTSPGIYEITIHSQAEYTWIQATQVEQHTYSDTEPAPPVDDRIELSWSHRVEVFSAGTPPESLVAWIEDPAATEQLRTRVGFDSSKNGGAVYFKNMQVPVAFDVYFVEPGAEPAGEPASRVTYSGQSSGRQGVGINGFSNLDRTKTYDLVLRASRATAFNQPTPLDQIWPGEIRIAGIDLTVQKSRANEDDFFGFLWTPTQVTPWPPGQRPGDESIQP